MKNEILGVILVLLVAVGLGVGFLIGTGNQHTITTIQMVTTTLTVTAGTHFATPVTPTFSIGGREAVGTMCFILPLGSPSSLNVTASMPYTGLSNYTTAIAYSFAPFPLDSVFPAWLHPSMSPPYVVMENGKNVTATLQIVLDSSVQNGQVVNFAIHANFIDPESAESVIDVMGVEVVVNASASVLRTC